MLQNWIHRMEEGGGLRYLKYALIALFGIALFVGYNLSGFKNMANPEAMDAAQLARNIAENKGYKTLFVRPFSVFLIERADAEKNGIPPLGDTRDRSLLRDLHPDVANPPAYPLVLAGLMKAVPAFKYQTVGSVRIFNRGGRFWIYQPDFLIGLFNQALFLVNVLVIYFFARRFCDRWVASSAATVFLVTDLFWRFSMSGLSTMLLLLIFLLLAWALVTLVDTAREGRGSQLYLVFLAFIAGALLGIGCLARYSFGCLILPVIFFMALFLRQHRVIFCLALVAAFAVVVSPWLLRNYRLTHTPFGVAGYAMYEATELFPEYRLQRSLAPDLSVSRALYYEVTQKFVRNLGNCLREDLPKLGGGWISAFFVVGLLVSLKNPALRGLSNFTLLCLPVLLVAQCLGRTALSDDNPVINSENLLVLIAPLVIILGTNLFYTLLDQLVLPGREFRYLIIGLFFLLASMPAVLGLISPRPKAIACDPPRIQQISGWMKEKELIMSDVPWAVAWYGQRQCMWLTLDAQHAFFDVYDFRKPVKAVYLTWPTMDARFLSDWLRVGELSWGSFAVDSLVRHELPPYFPLRSAPAGFLPEQLFITDSSDRWKRPNASATIPSQ